jgi:hypothetical protein
MIKTALVNSPVRLTLVRLTCIGLTCIAVSGAPRPETSTYVSGNVASLKPNTGGTLVFTDKDSMIFRSGSAEVKVPYASILHAELGATESRTHDGPGFKILSRILKTETQLLTVEFKSGLGENQTMTLQLAKFVAPGVLNTIKENAGDEVASATKSGGTRAAAAAKASIPASADDKNAWWGDGYWKTTRNQDSWNTTVASK